MPKLLHALLIERGITSAAEAEAFLHPDETLLHDPLLLPDMDKAVARLRAALEAGGRICVYGDYDVDGNHRRGHTLPAPQVAGRECAHLYPRPPPRGLRPQ